MAPLPTPINPARIYLNKLILKSLKPLRTAVAINALLILMLSVSGLSASNSAYAQSTAGAHVKAASTPEKKPDGTWEGLKPEQQKILAPLEDDWDYMLPDSRKKWIQVSNLYPKMSQADQQRLQSRMMGWSNLSQKDRRLARENYLTSLKFPAEQKAEAWSAYQKLSDEQKKKLAQQELNKKKPTAVNAPTLQQHAVSQKSIVAPTLPATIQAPPENAPNTSNDNVTNNSSGGASTTP
jgi:hypothetical protein